MLTPLEELRAWQHARLLVRGVYSCCMKGPVARDFEFRRQICGASISIMSNIAEGFGRNSRADFGRFLDISRGSCREVQSLLFAGRDINYFDEASFMELYKTAEETARMLTAFAKYLRS